MRAPVIMLVACVMVLCAAVSSADTTFSRRVLATGDGDTVANRNRLYQSVAAHKQPIAPRSPAKAFERRRTTGKRLLDAAVANPARELLATGDGDTVANRNRLYQSVAAHKQPIAPRSPAKAFERRRTTGKHLLEAPVANPARELLATGDGDTVANRNRLYQSVAAHKQPVAPRSPAKAFERRSTAGKRLLDALSTVADPARELLATGDGDTVANRNRLYQSVAAHKQPIAPRSPAKAFERRRTTGKHLLEAPVANPARELLATGDGDTVANRNRLYQSVAAHKQPVAPRSPAKTFERRRTTGKL